MGVNTSRYEVTFGPAGSTPVPNSAVESFSSEVNLSGNTEQPIGFADGARASASITVQRSYAPAVSVEPVRAQVRERIGRTWATTFVGVVEQRRGNRRKAAVECAGFASVISQTKAYTPLFVRMPVATATTVASVEDPAAPGYRAGPINYLYWLAGGRPLQQAASYPSALFYYACDQALLAPKYAWTAGDDAWTEVQRLAVASGGQIYQDNAGVMRYRQPTAMIDATPGVLLGPEVWADATDDASRRKAFSSVQVSYTPRYIPLSAELINDTTPRYIEPGGSLSFSLEPQYPIYSISSITITASDFDNNPVTLTPATTILAARLDLTVTNSGSLPVVISRVVVTGRTVSPGQRQTITVGSGQPAGTPIESEYIQDLAHATRLGRLFLAFYGSGRPVITLSGCPFDTGRSVGEVVNVTVVEFGLSVSPCLILAMRPDSAGRLVSYDVAPIADLPRQSETFIIGRTYGSFDVRKLGF